MNIQVTPHTISITINTNINAGEYNITPCEFTFTEEYEDLTKEAIFSSCDGSVFKVSILNNQCTIPYEVLQQEGNVLLGVYAYETNDDELVLRYSPTPQYFNVKRGSFQVGNDPDLPSPTEWERVLEQINQAIEETNNLNITANKEGKVTTVTITKKDGTTQEVEINDGKDLEFKWEGTSLGVRQEGQTEYDYTDLKGDTGDTGATPNIQIGDVQTGDTSEVTITGTDENPILNFTLEKGDTGNGISSITKTSTSGLVDTYTITFTNGQTTTYEITNGANGNVVDVQVDGTSVVDNGIANIIGLTEMKQELEDMYNLLPKVQGTGETITLDGTVAGKLLVDLKGNTSQETTTGKNLLNLTNLTTQTSNGITITPTFENGKLLYITTSGTYSQTTYFTLNSNQTIAPNTQYIVTGGYSPSARLRIREYDSNDTNLSEYFDQGSGVNFTSKSNVDHINVQIVFYAQNSNAIFYPMVRLASVTDDTYEPYTNGASPNPDYPQDIHVVSGDNEIVVCGKNLLSNDITGSVSWGGTSVTYNGSEIKISKSGTGGISANAHTNIRYFSLEAGKTYTFSMNYKSGTIVTEGATYGWVFYIFGVFADGSTSGIDGNRWACSLSKTTTTPSNHITFTPDKDFIGFKLGCYISGVSPKTNGDVYFDCQVEVGEATTYEPYQSQSYPITLPEGMFLGWIPNTDYSDKIDKSSGKNLFDKNNINELNVYLDTTNNKLVSNNNNKSIYISCKPNTTYTISKTPSKRFGVAYTYTTPENNTAIYGTITNYDGASITITTDTNAQYLVVWLINSNISGEISYQTAIDTLQIEEGNATPYEPYGNVWYVNKQIGKIIFNGNENWTFRVMSEINRFDLVGLNSKSGSAQSNPILCNYFLSKYANEDNVIYLSTNVGALAIMSNNFSDLATFKTWLSNSNTMIYYALQTPTYTEITDSTLISQLEALNGARSYNPQTNVSQENNDKPFILDVTALKQLTQ